MTVPEQAERETAWQKIELPPATERGLVGQIMDAAWPEFGGNHMSGADWHLFSDTVRFTLALLPQSHMGVHETDVARTLFCEEGGDPENFDKLHEPLKQRLLRKARAVLALPAASPQPREGEWRPIETAPDNEFVDLWVVAYRGDEINIARGERSCNFRRVNGDWRNALGGRCESNGNGHGIKATHWMPRPAPPVIAEKRTP